jgi:hypothetical protein
LFNFGNIGVIGNKKKPILASNKAQLKPKANTGALFGFLDQKSTPPILNKSPDKKKDTSAVESQVKETSQLFPLSKPCQQIKPSVAAQELNSAAHTTLKNKATIDLEVQNSHYISIVPKSKEGLSNPDAGDKVSNFTHQSTPRRQSVLSTSVQKPVSIIPEPFLKNLQVLETPPQKLGFPFEEDSFFSAHSTPMSDMSKNSSRLLHREKRRMLMNWQSSKK